MVHALRILKCKKGHILPISYDNNKCGCHHNGKPCIIVMCKKCFEEAMKKPIGKMKFSRIEIPLDEEGKKIVEELG